jgi:hypothetical protein
MSYTIEISINIMKFSNITSIEEDITNIALEHDCKKIYNYSDTENYSKVKRNHLIISCNFEDNIIDFSNFIKEIKRIKNLHIESIFEEDKCKLIYASSYYLNSIEKEFAENYKKFKKERKYSFDEEIILQSYN